MQPYGLLQAMLLTGAIAARKGPRQVIVTVTEGVPPLPPSAPSPVPLSAPTIPWQQTSAVSVPTPISTIIPASSFSSSSSGALSLPPLLPSPPSSSSTAPASTGSGSAGAGKCGKGYTYCGYMLTGTHNFPQNEVDRSYCNGLPELCSGGNHKTNIGQAVFVCMDDQPSTIQLICACGGTCLNNATTNYIAHCDKPCVNA